MFSEATDDGSSRSISLGEHLGAGFIAVIVVGSIVVVVYLYCMATLCISYRRSHRPLSTKTCHRPTAIYELQDAYDEDGDLEEVFNVLNIFD